jgi:hypothetical protein
MNNGQRELSRSIARAYFHLFDRAELYGSIGRKTCRKFVKRHLASRFLVGDLWGRECRNLDIFTA